MCINWYRLGYVQGWICGLTTTLNRDVKIVPSIVQDVKDQLHANQLAKFLILFHKTLVVLLTSN